MDLKWIEIVSCWNVVTYRLRRTPEGAPADETMHDEILEGGMSAGSTRPGRRRSRGTRIG